MLPPSALRGVNSAGRRKPSWFPGHQVVANTQMLRHLPGQWWCRQGQARPGSLPGAKHLSFELRSLRPLLSMFMVHGQQPSSPPSNLQNTLLFHPASCPCRPRKVHWAVSATQLPALASAVSCTLPACSYLWITIVYNVTYTLALYALLLFYLGTHDLLAPFKPMLKFLVVKSIVFMTFWQVGNLA